MLPPLAFEFITCNFLGCPRPLCKSIDDFRNLQGLHDTTRFFILPWQHLRPASNLPPFLRLLNLTVGIDFEHHPSGTGLKVELSTV